jgi:AcrR family transcriptional regulator
MVPISRPLPRRSQAQRSAQTTARLIEATISVLHEQGYAATTTTLVAVRAGVSRGAMLHHYPTKVQLMTATVYATFERDIEAYRAALAKGGSLDVQIVRLIDTAWSCFKSPDGIAQTQIWIATQSDAELASMVLPVHKSINERSVVWLEALLGERIAGEGFSPQQILTYMIGSLRGLALEHVLGTSSESLEKSVALIKRTVASLLKQAV